MKQTINGRFHWNVQYWPIILGVIYMSIYISYIACQKGAIGAYHPLSIAIGRNERVLCLHLLLPSKGSVHGDSQKCPGIFPQ